MQRLAHLFSFLAAIAAGFAILQFVLSQFGQPEVALAVRSTAPEQNLIVVRASTEASGDWPAVFGVPAPIVEVVEQPEIAVVDEPTPPPKINQTYKLKGLVAGGTDSWAIVSDPSGDFLLHVGDSLGDNMTVTSISSEGVWLKTALGPELIEFTE